MLPLWIWSPSLVVKHLFIIHIQINSKEFPKSKNIINNLYNA